MKCHRQYICLFLQVIYFVANCLAENLILNINFKKPIAITDHAFLSFTLDLTTLQHNDFIKNIEKSTNLARGLAPAYIRLGGPQNNFYNFEVYSHKIDTNPNDVYFGTQWTLVYQWAKNAGLDVIACITPYYIDNELKTDSRDPRNIAELLSFSDRMGYNVSWQLGYECQTRCELSGAELGRYVTNLHKMLKTFPRYSNSLITGPDIVEYKTVQQQKYLQDYLHSANVALSAITWHPNLNSVSVNNGNISIYYDNMIAEKNELYKIISRTGKKPLWIESKLQESEHQYLGALIWTKRLGDTAKLGIQVVMKQLSNLFQATPIFWVSLLYKTLVGREVLEMKFQSNNESYVHFYSQCTKPSTLYNKGAITIFGINLTPRKVTINLKEFKIKILHKYILLPDFETDFLTDNKMFSQKVLLNNKPLNLINDKKLPDITPEIIINPDGLELELFSSGIGFWIIPNAKVKACTYSEEEIIENNIVKKLSKRHENNIQQDNQEEKEEDINQANLIENDVKKSISQSNLRNWKIYRKQDNKKQKNIENIKTKSQQKVWNSKLFAKIIRILQKRLQKMDKNESSNSQKSFIIDLKKKQENSSEEVEEQQNKRDLKKMEVDDKFESIRDILKKYKYILLEKKTEMKTGSIQHLKSEIQNIDNAVMLISKIEASLLYKIISKKSILNEVKNKIKNKEKLIIIIIKKLKDYLIELESSPKIKTNIFKNIEKYFNELYNLLEDIDSPKNNKKSQDSIPKDLMERKRFKRYLDRKKEKKENSKKIRILKKRSRIDDLKDHVSKQKIKRENDNGKKLILSNNIDNSKKNFINNKNKYNNLLQRDFVKRFFKSDAFENTAHHIDQHLIQESNKIENDIYRKNFKIGDIKKYQNFMQEPKKSKRDISKKLVEIGLRKDSASRKHSRIDDLKNYVNERKTKQKDDIKRKGLLIPFQELSKNDPRTIDSDEDNFYGFFRQDPVKGFPEGDIFVTMGDSLEQNDKNYDYVEDEDDNDDGSEKKSMQHSQKSMLNHTEDNTSIEEVKNDHCDYMPTELFENIKLSNTRISENSKNYDDLWEAEFSSEKYKNNNNNNNNNNNEITVAGVNQEQSPNKKKKRFVRKTNVQQLVNFYNDFKEQGYPDVVRLASRHLSSFNQLFKTPTSNINYQASNVELKEAKLKMGSESIISNSFHLPFQVSTVKYNDNYQTSNMNYGELKKENDFIKDTDSRDDINVKTQYSRPSIYAEHSIHDKNFSNKRNKRSNWQELRKIFTEEIIKEDEENSRDCHCRVIRAFDSPKKLYRHVKRNVSVPASVTNTSSENKNMNTKVIQFKKNLITKQEYEKIMTEEILPSTSDIEPDYEKNSITTESVITELSTLDHKLNNTTQVIDVISTSEMDKISEQYHNTKKSINLLPMDSDSDFSLNNNNNVKYVTKETFFRTQPPDIQSENKTETYDFPQIISKTPSKNEDIREQLIVSITNNAQKAIYKKEQDFINKKTDSSIYPTIIEDQKNEEEHNNKIGLKSTNSLKEIIKGIDEQITTETILSKPAANITKDANTKRLETILQNLPRASLERLIRHERYLKKRTDQIDKLKEKLYARRGKLLHQYQNELTKITEQKRNLKKRETWDRLRENDNFHRLIDQKFIGILLNNDIIYEDDDESYLIPIKLVPKQYKNIMDQIYLLAKAKKVCYPEYNEYYQFLRNLIEDDEELTEMSKSSERKYNQYYEYIPKIIKHKQESKAKFLNHDQDYQYSSETIKDEREKIENTSRFFDRKVFIIDPSTYYGDESILQLHKDYLKLPKYHSKIKSQIQEPTSRWMLRNIHQIFTKLQSDEAQYLTATSQEYTEKLPIKNYYDQENTNILYVLDTQKQYDLSKEFAQNWPNSLNRRNVNQAISNKEADELNKNTHKNLKDKDNLNSFAINEKIEFIKDFGTERNTENKEFASSNRKKDVINSETIEDAEKVIKTKKSENELIKYEKIKKSYNSNNKAKHNLNIKIFNNNKTVEHVGKIIEDNPKEKELGKENTQSRRDVGKQTDECIEQLLQFLIKDIKNNKLDHTHVRLTKEFLKEIFDKQPMMIFLLTKIDRSSNADLSRKNYLVSSRRDFKINPQNKKEYELNYITFIPIEIKNIYEMLDKNNDDLLERFEIPIQWNDQYVLKKISGPINKYLDDEISEDFEYEDFSNQQSENSENILDEESNSNKQDVSIENSEVKSRKDEQYRITNDEIDKYLKIKNQIRSNKRGMFLSFPWRNVKKRQRRQIKSEINEDTATIRCKISRQSQPNKSILAENLENKRTKRYYLNNNINKEEKENMIETNDIRINYLQSQTNKKNRDDLLENFIKIRKKNNYNNKISSIRNIEKNETITSNNISKSEKLLQNKIPRLQNHMESMKEFVNDSEENFNDTLASDEDKHHKNRTSEITGNAFYTTIMNIKDFFCVFIKNFWNICA